MVEIEKCENCGHYHPDLKGVEDDPKFEYLCDPHCDQCNCKEWKGFVPM